jgi:hypothetical protein
MFINFFCISLFGLLTVFQGCSDCEFIFEMKFYERHLSVDIYLHESSNYKI